MKIIKLYISKFQKLKIVYIHYERIKYKCEYACVILYIIIKIKMPLKLSVKSSIRHNKVYILWSLEKELIIRLRPDFLYQIIINNNIIWILYQL